MSFSLAQCSLSNLGAGGGLQASDLGKRLWPWDYSSTTASAYRPPRQRRALPEGASACGDDVTHTDSAQDAKRRRLDAVSNAIV